ncbi:sigma-70 family RNA polymerase sigma factor [Sphingomonas bacterium]|uniref:sigma-70 family RNA polymerase sigma factor n=1 Tax=Sphingomonas bacterium TaxID=1895847 RepID=UPI0015769AFD|nr:sigma-70 family RNA polymerase sigma factor [Sphingomonas bacterium]
MSRLPDSTGREELVRLLVATGQADRGAFASLYVATSAKLFGICLRICGERQAAEDVLQEVYATVWRRADGYEPGRGSPIAWLGAIARNRAIDRRRALGLRPAASIEAVAEPVDEAPLASDLLLMAEEERRLLACIDQLTTDQRGAIRTAFFDGLTYAELAVRSGVPLGTAKSWIRRGLISLRGCLDGDA